MNPVSQAIRNHWLGWESFYADYRAHRAAIWAETGLVNNSENVKDEICWSLSCSLGGAWW